MNAVGSRAEKSGERNQTRAGLLFILPAFLHLTVFVLFPILFAFVLSLHRWDVLKPNRPFVGLENYAKLLHDPLFWNALGNSALYTLGSVPLGMALALGVAVLVNQRLRGTTLFRTLFYLPAVSSAVALAMVWTFLYLPERGLLAWTLGAVGLTQAAQTDWLQNPFWAMPALIFMSLWTGLGPRMVLFLAGLQSVPAALYEAAAIDGAGHWSVFRHITLPLLLPTTLFVLVTSTISAFQVFTPVYMMTRGGPVRHTDVVGYHIYNTAWRQFHLGTASAQSYVLFLVVLAVSSLQFRLMQKRISGFTVS